MKINELFNVKDKVVLVTGGGRGVGATIAEGFVINGAKVYICSRKEKNCLKTSQFLNNKGPGTCHYIVADLSNLKGVEKLVEEIKQKESKLDILINNSGAVWAEDFEQTDEKSYDKVLNLNLKSPFFLTQRCLPLLKKAGSKENSARVINIGSISGLLADSTNRIPYNASKAGLHHMSKVLGAILSQDNINVNAIALGLYKTDLTKGMLEMAQGLVEKSVPMDRAGLPEEIAGTCLFLSSKAGGYITGSVISVDGGSITGMKPAL